MELLAALLGANLSAYVAKTLQLEKDCQIIYWSDSQIVLSWLSSTKKLQQFVQTRINKIKEITGPHIWRFCPTSTNPADLLTRGMNTTTFYRNRTLWFEGPSWLKAPEDQWPTIQTKEQTPDSESPQMNTAVKPDDSPNVLNTIDLTRYSTLNRAIRITAKVLQIRNIWRKTNVSPTITNELMQNAQLMLLKGTQSRHFESEVLLPNKKTPKTKKPAIVQQLGLYLDDQGLIRCRGRLQNTELSYDTKFPILLPKHGLLTTLIIRTCSHSTYARRSTRNTKANTTKILDPTRTFIDLYIFI